MGSHSPEHHLKRAQLNGLSPELLERGSSYGADLLIYELEGEKVVVKDFRDKPRLWRVLFGLFLTNREARVLRALEGMKGVPQFRGKLDRYAIAMSYVAGKNPAKVRDSIGDKAAFVRELEELVAEMHRRGVVHLDLKHRSNLVVTQDGRPAILDFASGMCFSPRWFGGRLAVRLLGWADRLGVLKWKRRFCPDALTEAEARRLKRARRFEAWMLPVRLAQAVLRLCARNTDSAGEGDVKGQGPRPWGLFATLGFCLLALLVVLLIQLGVMLAFMMGDLAQFASRPQHVLKSLESNGVFQAVAGIASIPVAAGLLVVLAKLRKGYPLRDYLGLRGPTKGELLKWFAVVGAFMVCSDALTLLLGRPLVPTVMVDLYKTPGAAPFMNFLALLVAPVCEEVSFRGFMFQGIRRSRLGAAGAVVLTALAWSAIHFQYDAYGIATVFAIGILLAVARLKTGSVYLAVAMHFFNNLVATLQVLWVLHA